MNFLIDETGRRFWCDGDALNTDLGAVRGISSAKPGDVLKSSKGKKFTVIEPSFEDLFESMKRGPQVVRIKDAAYIAGKVGVCSGFRIVDAGAGSGALACFLARLCGPGGHVYSYENRREFAKIAAGNAGRLGMKNMAVIEKDVYKGIAEKDLDLVTLDLAEPWKVFRHLKELKAGKYVVCYVPTVEQVQKVVQKVTKGLVIDEVCEVNKREWLTDGRTRPKNVGLVHTGFLIFVRKVS